jgi:hypothetical protein
VKVYQVFIGFEKAYEFVRLEVLYNIHIEFGIGLLKKVVGLIKI